MKLELAKPGTYGQDGATITEADLLEVKDTFETDTPISLGHTLADFMPAFGWVKNLDFDPKSKTLSGNVEFNDLLKDAFDQKLYNKWSVGIKKRASDGKKYLHHLAMLGAIPPKIKDLKILEGKIINMADADEVWTFTLGDATEDEIRRLYLKQRKIDFELYLNECLTRQDMEPHHDKITQMLGMMHSMDFSDLEKAKKEAKNMNPKKEEKKDPTPEKKAEEEKKEPPKAELSEAEKKRITFLEGQVLKDKKARLQEAVTGKLPKDKHVLVMNLADQLKLDEVIELSDADGTKSKISALDLLIEIFKNIPMPVQPGALNMGDVYKDEKGQEINLIKYV